MIDEVVASMKAFYINPVIYSALTRRRVLEGEMGI